MLTISKEKQVALEALQSKEGFIAALAIDQRGALKKMIGQYQEKEATAEQIEKFKAIVSSELTPYTSAILLDPEYGLSAAMVRYPQAGLLLAYEQTGYDVTTPGRLPDTLNDWSVKRLKEQRADACKFLLYYDVDEPTEINQQKQVFIERIGSECTAEELPFFLELVSYDATISDVKSAEYAKVKPRKVSEMMKEFSQSRYGVDVLKVEVPVNMNYVEGFAKDEIVYSETEAINYFKEQAKSSQLPFIFLSGGVSAELFQETLRFAKKAGSTFNGVLCGRATWADGVEIFVKEGEEAARRWMQNQGRKNIETLNEVLRATATAVNE